MRDLNPNTSKKLKTSTRWNLVKNPYHTIDKNCSHKNLMWCSYFLKDLIAYICIDIFLLTDKELSSNLYIFFLKITTAIIILWYILAA